MGDLNLSSVEGSSVTEHFSAAESSHAYAPANNSSHLSYGHFSVILLLTCSELRAHTFSESGHRGINDVQCTERPYLSGTFIGVLMTCSEVRAHTFSESGHRGINDVQCNKGPYLSGTFIGVLMTCSVCLTCAHLTHEHFPSQSSRDVRLLMTCSLLSTIHFASRDPRFLMTCRVCTERARTHSDPLRTCSTWGAYDC